MVDRAEVARHATIVREGRRAEHRTEELAAALAAPDMAGYLTEVDRRWPGLVATERLRLARILAGRAGTVRYSAVVA